MIGRIVLIIAAAIAVLLVVWIRIKLNQANEDRIRHAASVLNRERELNQALSHRLSESKGKNRLFLLVSWRDPDRQSYLFDPGDQITIGRSVKECQICIRDEKVSGRHCRLLVRQRHIYLQDLSSSNGTWVRRGWKKERLTGFAMLSDGGRFTVGDITFCVRLYCYDGDTTFL